MKNYFKIGVLVQMLIIIFRTANGKVKRYFNRATSNEEIKVKDIGLFAIGAVIGLALNIVLWPIAIVAEIFNTINDI